MIHTFHFGLVSKQAICQDLHIFKMESQKIPIKSQVKSQTFELDLYSSNRISMCSNRNLSHNRDWDLPITTLQKCLSWHIAVVHTAACFDIPVLRQYKYRKR